MERVKAKRIPLATHAGTIKLGSFRIPCAVLDNGKRVLSARQLLEALGRSPTTPTRKDGDDKLPRTLVPAGLIPFIDQGLRGGDKLVIFCPLPGSGYTTETAEGYSAEAFAALCMAYLKARTAGQVRANQLHIVERAELLVQGFATVGIVSLIDDATGYVEIRDKEELARILAKFVTPEIQPWVRRFPPEYYQEIYRLQQWEDLDPNDKDKPGIVGSYTNDLVYGRLAPGVLERLHELVPRNERGKLEHKLHQQLTGDWGVKELETHLMKLIILMKSAGNWDQFMRLVNRSMPRYRSTLAIPFEDGDE